MNETLRTIGALDRLIAAALTTVSADTRKAILATANCGVAGHFRFQENGGICMMCQREHQIKTAAERTASQLAVVNERVVDRLVEEKRQLRVENNAQYLARVAAESQLAEVTKERNKSKADRQRWVDSWHFDTERLTAERDAALADAASARTAMSDAIRRETRLRDAVKCEIADLDDIIIGIDIQHPVTRESIQRQMQRLNAALSHQPKGGESNMQEFHTDLGGSMTPQPGKPVIADGPIPLASQAHNPDNLSQEQVGVADGWRLLDVDEVKNVPEVFLRDIQLWLGTKWDGTKWRGAGVGDTYRTRLSRVELRKARGLPDSCDVCGGKNGKHLKSCSINYIPRPVESGSDDASKTKLTPQHDIGCGRVNEEGECDCSLSKPAPAQPETPTPRTDAVYLNLEGQDCDAECYETLIEHARTLERELCSAREATAKALAEQDEAMAARKRNFESASNALRDLSAERAARERAEKEAEDQFQTERVRAIKAEKERDEKERALRAAGYYGEDRGFQEIQAVMAQLAEAQQQRDAALASKTVGIRGLCVAIGSSEESKYTQPRIEIFTTIEEIKAYQDAICGGVFRLEVEVKLTPEGLKKLREVQADQATRKEIE